MDDLAFFVIIISIAIGFSLVIIVLNLKIRDLKSNSAAEMMKADVIELSRVVGQLQQSVGDRIDRSGRIAQMSMQKQLSESAKLVAEVSSRLAKIDETNKRVVDVATELKTLQNVLQNPKQRGVFGEYYLQTVLENVLAPGQYDTQYRFADGETVDAVIFLEKGRILPIDSKFSLENYNRMVDSSDRTERDRLMARVRTDLKARIDETSKYIRTSENTMDFAFMFIPSEALYYNLLVGDVGSGGSARDLIEYAFRDKRVIIVSPTSFMAYLQTVLQGLRSLQIEEQAKDIQKRVGKLGKHIAQFEGYMQRLGSSLSVTVNHYNNAHKELAKVDKDIIKIAKQESSVQPLMVDRPQKEE